MIATAIISVIARAKASAQALVVIGMTASVIVSLSAAHQIYQLAIQSQNAKP